MKDLWSVGAVNLLRITFCVPLAAFWAQNTRTSGLFLSSCGGQKKKRCGCPMTARLAGMRKWPSNRSGALKRLEWKPVCEWWMAFLSLSPLSFSLAVGEMKQNHHSKLYSHSSNKEFMLHQSVRTQAFSLSLSVTVRIWGIGANPHTRAC